MMLDAIEGTYNVRIWEDDVNLAFLILQYGRPEMLDIVHRRGLNFRSTSNAYRLLQKSRNIINSSVTTEINQFVGNFNLNEEAPSHRHMLKVDETYAEPRARNPQDNKLYGLGYEHSRNLDLEFSSRMLIN